MKRHGATTASGSELRLAASLSAFVTFLILVPAPVAAQVTSRISVGSSGAEGSGTSERSRISSNGRFVVFVSQASDLVADDGNKTWDVFVHDRDTAATECVSLDPSGATGNGASGTFYELPAISADGRFVAFTSDATNLIPGTSSSGTQVFVRDRETGLIEIASVDDAGIEGDGFSDSPSISGDGRFVAFESASTNLAAGDTNNVVDVFVHDRATGGTDRVSLDPSGASGNGESRIPVISSDGQIVAFSSVASNLVTNDTNGCSDAFVYDRRTATIERTSIDASGAEGDGPSYAGPTSANGQIASIVSSASNLVSGDTNRVYDVFVRDRAAGTTERASIDSGGAEGDGGSLCPSLSADGDVIAFASFATNLVAGDTNGTWDVFIHDRRTLSTLRATVDLGGGQADSGGDPPNLSADGGTVSYSSSSSDLVTADTNGVRDVFVRDAHVATWCNYDSGVAGTFGVPSLTLSANPVIGATITVDLSNSRGSPTIGLLVLGCQRARIPTHGGELLVDPSLIVPISFSYGSDSFDGTIPSSVVWCGVTLDLQGVDLDPGAVAGVSFSPGLELVIGN
jgi:Tol biopolymer transport system component